MEIPLPTLIRSAADKLASASDLVAFLTLVGSQGVKVPAELAKAAFEGDLVKARGLLLAWAAAPDGAPNAGMGNSVTVTSPPRNAVSCIKEVREVWLLRVGKSIQLVDAKRLVCGEDTVAVPEAATTDVCAVLTRHGAIFTRG